MLPTSIRIKQVTINSKKIKIRPWSNLTLTEFEGIHDSEDDTFKIIDEFLIQPFIETKDKLTLIEKRYILIELFKLSRGNLLDILYTCSHCGTRSAYSLRLDEIVNYSNLSSQTIKTKNYIFNLKKNSSYCIDYNSDKVNTEALIYVASFIQSIEDSKDVYEITDMLECSDWLNNELPQEDFKELTNQFYNIQPNLYIKAEAICEICSEITELDFKGIENFLGK